MNGRRCFIGLGSNQGDRHGRLEAAITSLDSADGVEVVGTSGLYETEPVGEILDQPDFLNAVVELSSTLEPDALRAVCKAIEADQGRDFSAPRHSPRPVDLDLLFIEGVELQTELLTIPHPELYNRRFVLIPMADLAADLELEPGLTVAAQLEQLGDTERVEPAGRLPGR